jgi:hypothetical protein
MPAAGVVAIARSAAMVIDCASFPIIPLRFLPSNDTARGADRRKMP